MIPTIALAELGIRGKLSLELFGLVTTQQLSILAVSAGIWVSQFDYTCHSWNGLFTGFEVVQAKRTKVINHDEPFC